MSCASKSFAEVEYKAIATMNTKLLWISYLLRDFKVEAKNAIPLLCDNKSPIQMLENLVYHDKYKRIDIDCHFFKHHYLAGFVQPVYVESSKQLADVFTKPLGASQFLPIVFKLNVSCFHVKLEGGVLKESSSTYNSKGVMKVQSWISWKGTETAVIYLNVQL